MKIDLTDGRDKMKYNEMPESSTKIDINYNKETLYVKSKANPGHLNWIFTLFLVISVTILLSVYRPLSI